MATSLPETFTPNDSRARVCRIGECCEPFGALGVIVVREYLLGLVVCFHSCSRSPFLGE